MAFNLGIALGAGVNNYIDTNAKIARTKIDALSAAKLQKDFAQEGEYDESFRTQAALGQSNAGETFDKGIDYGNAEQNAAVRAQVLSLKPEEQQAFFKQLHNSEVDQRVRSAIPVSAPAAAPSGEPSATPAGATPFVAQTNPNIRPTEDFYGKPVREAMPVGAPGSPAAASAPLTAQAEAPQRQGIDLSNVKISGGQRSHEEITAGVMEDMARSGNMAGWTKAAGINKLAREVTAATATDKIFKEGRAVTAEWEDSVKKNGMAATIDLFGDRLTAQGINVKNVVGRDGKPGVAVLDADGRTERVLSSQADVTKEFQSAHRSYVMNQLSTIPGTSAKDAVSIYSDMEKGNYYAKDIKLKQAMQPFLMAQSRASTNASNASSAHNTGAESRAAALHPTALRLAEAGASNAETGKVSSSYTAEDGQIVNKMDNGKFRFAGNNKVIDSDQFATTKLTPMPTRNGSTAQTHRRADTGEELWTRSDEAGHFNSKGDRVEVPNGMAVLNKDAPESNYNQVSAGWRATLKANQASEKYNHDGSENRIARSNMLLNQDETQYFRAAGMPTPTEVNSFTKGVFPTGFKWNGKDVGGQRMPQGIIDDFFKKNPTVPRRAIN